QMALLRRAQQRYPDDFWVNVDLAIALYASVFPTGEDRPAREEELPALHEAIRFHTAALALRPQSPLVHHNLGVALYANKDPDGAIACYRKALALDPQLGPAHRNLGAALAAKGDLAGAITHFKKALALDPIDALGHYNLGVALREKGDLAGAIAHF